jgi:hypothetical protein
MAFFLLELLSSPLSLLSLLFVGAHPTTIKPNANTMLSIPAKNSFCFIFALLKTKKPSRFKSARPYLSNRQRLPSLSRHTDGVKTLKKT